MEECRSIQDMVAELTKKVTDQVVLTEKCATTVDHADGVRRFINKMNKAVERIKVCMDGYLEKWDEVGTITDEQKCAGIGLCFWLVPVTKPVANMEKQGSTKLILKPPKTPTKK